MAKPIAGVPRIVWGPTPKKGRFQVVVETTDKKRHARTFSKRAEAVTFADEARSKIERPKPVADDSERGTSVWWRGVLSRAAAQIEAATADPLQAGRVLASLGVAAAKHATDAETEGRLNALEEKERKRQSMRKHGPKAERQRVPTTEPPVPGTPVRK